MATIDKLFKVQKNSHQIRKGKGRGKKEYDASTSDITKTSVVVNTVDNDIEKLKQFDLNPKYGPCTGLTRQERWRRAEKFSFDPPQEILDLILSHANDKKYTEKFPGGVCCSRQSY